MKILTIEQGSDEWKEIRTRYKVASEAPVMMGASPHMTRDELLQLKTTGSEREINEWVEKFIFKKGHEVEALARPIAEQALGEDLYPLVGVNEVAGVQMLASFDGITAPLYDVHWEHKQLNKELFGLVTADAELPPYIYWQLEHQLAVNGNKHCIFAVSDGTPENYAETGYHSRPERRAQLIEGWKQFERDLAEYVPQESEVKPVGVTIKSLPALVVEIVGDVKSSNLAIYKDYALDFIRSVNTNLQTDQDFADAENVVKFCDRVEKELAVTKKQVLSQAISVNEVLNTIDAISEEHRQTRLKLAKLIESEKNNRKLEIITEAKHKWASYVIELNQRLKVAQLPAMPVDFAAAGKNKRTIDTFRSSINDALAGAKVIANVAFEKISANIEKFDQLAANHQFLFNDASQLFQKEPDAFEAIVKNRISDYENAERIKREEAAEKERLRLEAEREKIRLEEEAKAAAKVAAEAERVRKEEAAKAEQARLAELAEAEEKRRTDAKNHMDDRELLDELFSDDIPEPQLNGKSKVIDHTPPIAERVADAVAPSESSAPAETFIMLAKSGDRYRAYTYFEKDFAIRELTRGALIYRAEDIIKNVVPVSSYEESRNSRANAQ